MSSRAWMRLVSLLSSQAPTTELEFLVLFDRCARTLIRSAGSARGTDAASAGKAT